MCKVQASPLQRSVAELKDGTQICLSGAFFLEFRKGVSNSQVERYSSEQLPSLTFLKTNTLAE